MCPSCHSKVTNKLSIQNYSFTSLAFSQILSKLKGWPHTFDTAGWKCRSMGQRKIILPLTCVWHWRTWFKGWSFFPSVFGVKKVHFRPRLKQQRFSALQNHQLGLDKLVIHLYLCTQQKRDQSWNQTPLGYAHVKAKSLLPLSINLCFKIVVLKCV